MALNVELLLKVKDAILAEPEKFDMSNFSSEDGYTPLDTVDCGTTCCISGWAATIHNQETGDRIEPMDGEIVLGIPRSFQSLFFTCDWPDTYSKLYVGAFTDKERAQVAADYIDHFIATYDPAMDEVPA